ncbi:neutral zinc metallopeptidase [Calothrix rhizosoleniae]|uniref:neutral zinc metallopeptidase n=1 Tax=Calothrix rhizosoleniae TaxID=888997 RepID=UPI000B4A489B|nr:neutral zinc metallopeptidase [Calothrix rhizosoleniae]
MKIFKVLTTVAIGIGTLLGTLPAHGREWHPRRVVNEVYAGIQKIHGYKATPRLIWNVIRGKRGACGPIYGSHYCTKNHTVYIPNTDIRMAYQHGDAALAYIIAHEYAHAMQTAYQFRPGVGHITELQADCLAGVYLGLLPNVQLDNQDIREVATFAHRIGDYARVSAHHHGTPRQRVKAVMLGMEGSVNGKGVSTCRI